MKKIISLILTLCTLLTMFTISPLTSHASELKDYRSNIINAVLNNESDWSSIRGNKVESFFMDLNFDGKNEYVVVIYGQGIMLTTRIFYYGENGFSEATDDYTMSTINATSFEYYFHQTENKYLVLGTKSSKSGFMSTTTDNYEFIYDRGITILSYSSVKVNNQNYSYYKYVKGESLSITKTEYDTHNSQKLKHCANANVHYKTINYSNWKAMSKEEKTEALEKSYDGFTYKHFRSLEIGKDTNQFPNDYTGSVMIHNHSYRTLLFDSIKTDVWENKILLAYAMHNRNAHGLCYGICLSMCLAKNNYLDLDTLSNGNNAQNYWEIGSYLNNPNFLDLLIFYHLQQHPCFVEPRAKITNNTFTKLHNAIFPDQNLTEFLTILVTEATYAQEKGKLFLFSYNEGNDSHCVAVVGYYKNPETNKHELTIYDVNSYSEGDNTEDIHYLTMTINDDYQKFSFRDQVCLNTNGKDLFNTWKSMEIIDYNQINTESAIIKGNEPVSANDNVSIVLKMNKRFKMVNDKGNYLLFDGNEFQGDMKLYDYNFIGDNSDNSYWKFTIDPSSSFTFTDMDPDFEVIGETTTCGFSAKANGANTIKAVNDTLAFIGDNYGFSGAFETDNNYLFVEIDGNAKGTTILKKESNQTIMLAPQNPIENTGIKSYSIDSLQTKQVGKIYNISEININTGSITTKHSIGDVNKDNKITIDDVTVIQRHIAEMITLSNDSLVLADTNRDGKVDINDASHLQRYLAEFDVKL